MATMEDWWLKLEKNGTSKDLYRDWDERLPRAIGALLDHTKADLCVNLGDFISDGEMDSADRFRRYVAAIAENRDGQVLGFGALDAHPWFKGLMEMGGLVVNPIARGLGLGDMLDDYRIEIGATRGIRGLFATPVMPNPASQKLLTRHGFIPSGMYFHAGGPESLGGSGDGFHPMDCGFSVYIYNKEAEHKLYVPDECKTFVEDVYNEIGLRYTFEEGSIPNEVAPAETELDLNPETVSKLLEVKVEKIGPDYSEKIMGLEYFAPGSETQALMMLIEMTDPLCPELYDYLRGQGFIFTGLVPGGENDLMVMQHLRHPVYRDFLYIEPDYERILNRLYTINGADM